MNVDPRNVIVTENDCGTCGVDTVSVHHQSFPEMRIGGPSVDEAAERLANQLTSSIDVVTDPAHREPIHQAIADIRAFLDKKGEARAGRD